MPFNFYKYHGTGNDFILIDDRNLDFPFGDFELIRHLCHRQFGIGADGLILLQHDKVLDFRMVYYNADGLESSMCGNGGRCIIAFSSRLGVIEKRAKFRAIDGIHSGEILPGGNITLSMQAITSIEKVEQDYILNTGSPHYVVFCNDPDKVDLIVEARKIRCSDKYAQMGINVNFVSVLKPGFLKIRTYERGVENETLSCGTGVVASSLAYAAKEKIPGKNYISVKSPGGVLEVSFDNQKGEFKEIVLTGPAQFVFEGSYP